VKILFIGDVVGRRGRQAARYFVERYKSAEGVSFVIANGENAAGGVGITPDTADELLSFVDVLTSGNHIWKKKEIINYMFSTDRLLRPANYPEDNPGEGYFIGTAPSGAQVAVINLEGRVFMDHPACPFRTAQQLVEKIRQRTNIIIVDFHAEATSEKAALGWFLDGKVTAVLGTHTHVQTADERILPGGTAFISDVGMVGPRDSVIGMKPDSVIQRFLTGMPHRFETAKGVIMFNAVLIEVEPESGRALSIKRINELWERRGDESGG